MKKSNIYLIASIAILIIILSGILFFLKPGIKTNTESLEIVTNNQTVMPDQIETSSEYITSSTLAMHNSESDCWVGFQGKAYDVTSYLSRHPGGKRTIIPYCGTSSEFEKAFLDYHGNSQTSTFFRTSTMKGNLI